MDKVLLREVMGVNKDLLVENLDQESLIGQRIVYDYFSSLNVKIHEFKVPLGLEKSSRFTCSRYKTTLESKRNLSTNVEKDRKRKLKMDELVDVKVDVRDSIVSCIKLNIDNEKYSFEAEEKQNMTIPLKGHALRKYISEKQELVKTLQDAIVNLENECKSI